MSLKLCVLGSGSSGNCTYVASEHTRILVDAGLSYREIGVRLETATGTKIDEINAVCVTHEHDDHTASLGVFHRRGGTPLYANAGTVEAIERGKKESGLPWKVFETGSAFDIGDIRLEPFSVPHDSLDPVGFVVSCGEARAGIVTDMGMATELIRERLRRCQAVVIESNHDEQMLKDSGRPWPLKQRIAGRQGHLSNRQAAELAGEIAGPELKIVFLAHLSSDCNRPDVAVRAVQDLLNRRGHGNIAVKLTYPDRPSDVVEI